MDTHGKHVITYLPALLDLSVHLTLPPAGLATLVAMLELLRALLQETNNQKG